MGKNNKYYKEFREWLENLRDVPCMDCGIKYPQYIMEFDHTRGKKTRKISTYRGKRARLIDLQICDIVCSNCHKERTHNRQVKKSG